MKGLQLFAILTCSFWIIAHAGNFYQDFDTTWGDGRAKILNNGQLLTLTLDKTSGSGFQSKNEYLFGKLDMQIKLVPGNSAGTVTAYYVIKLLLQITTHRNSSFDRPYSFMVDGTPIRDFKNLESRGIAVPKNQPMKIYSSLWNADDWATRGGAIKTDWSNAPFQASYRNFNADACVRASNAPNCAPNAATSSKSGWLNQELDSTGQERMKWVQQNYMIYNYCIDLKRFPQLGLPPECSVA